MLEPYFRFCRMDVYIDVLEGNRYEHDDDRKRSRGQNVPIRLADPVQNNLVAHQPSVDEEEHRIPVVLLHVRAGRKEMHLYAGPTKSLLMFDELIEQVLPENLKDTITKTFRCRRGKDFEAPAFQNEINVRKSERVMSAKGRNLAQLVRL